MADTPSTEQKQWFERWQENRIGFHETEINPWLAKHGHELEDPNVLVPLCGKSLDMIHLTDRGKLITGIELVPQAVESFFAEQSLTAERRSQAAFQVYRSRNISIWQGDFFTFQSTISYDIYDRAALVAMNAELRPRYAQQILKLLSSRMLLITIEYAEGAMQGPPYSISPQEVQQLYGGSCHIRRLDTAERAAPQGGHFPCRESLYLLSRTE
ncbi:hypothetical protein P0082_09505 [Candidatus Haliotispira prima]|uniref:thiopurine S-methyltransferase n=1 Tax=Candidatus Haliotispira prima TaxID=3034016 RepID=A0ABY8MFR8_9SPIO|nr:hypothetical protein P0082_09505 [Candidatus Haliotispira prima]